MKYVSTLALALLLVGCAGDRAVRGHTEQVTGGLVQIAGEMAADHERFLEEFEHRKQRELEQARQELIDELGEDQVDKIDEAVSEKEAELQMNLERAARRLEERRAYVAGSAEFLESVDNYWSSRSWLPWQAIFRGGSGPVRDRAAELLLILDGVVNEEVADEE